MLFLPPGTSRLIRVHGAYIDETEIGRIVSHIKAQGPPSYDETITQSDEEALGSMTLMAIMTSCLKKRCGYASR